MKFIIPIIHVNKSGIQAQSLFEGKVIDENVVGIVFVRSIETEDTTNNMIGRE